MLGSAGNTGPTRVLRTSGHAARHTTRPGTSHCHHIPGNPGFYLAWVVSPRRQAFSQPYWRGPPRRQNTAQRAARASRKRPPTRPTAAARTPTRKNILITISIAKFLHHFCDPRSFTALAVLVSTAPVHNTHPPRATIVYHRFTDFLENLLPLYRQCKS